FDAINPMMEIATEDLKKDWNSFLEEASKVKNIGAVDYSKLCDEIIDSMDQIIYSIFLAPKDNYYFLPDNSSITYRSKLQPDTKLPDGRILVNPSTFISSV
ncbi:MAG: hypothetical protein ABR595_10545, partial [Psychroflexus sp.]